MTVLMEKRFFLTLVLALVAMLPVSAQRKLCINDNWKFFYGDGSEAVKNPMKATGWRTLALPHDWSVETEAAEAAEGRRIGPFSKKSAGRFQTGHTVGGEGWYVKTLNVTEEDLQGRVSLYFEGAYNQSWVYVNGEECNHNVYGYNGFKFDVTDKLHVGENSVVVKVVNNGNNTRWYAGSGIFRHVWMIRTPNLYVDEWDTFVKTEDNRKVVVTSAISNKGKKSLRGRMDVKVIDAEGNVVCASQTKVQRIEDGESVDVSMEMLVENAKTWSPESPYLYTAVVSVEDADGNVIDGFTKKIGFRTLYYSAEEGFLLNGKKTLLRGGCLHHDNGLLGAAAFYKAERRKLLTLKEQGYNAVRCSHNLPSEQFIDICDEIGLMVIDEVFDGWILPKNAEDYHLYFKEHSDADLAFMLRRDRNHPSIIMWSIGNEAPGRIEPEGIAAAKRLREGVLKYDTTRPVTAAICGWDNGDAWNSVGGNWDAQSDKAFTYLDVAGYNYLYDKYEYDHRKYPARVMCGLESYPDKASENWDLVEKHPYVIGDFVWTAVDYLGEAGIGCAFETTTPPWTQGWPWFNGWCGDIDLIGQKKAQSYYRDVVWRQKPITMAVQSTSSYHNAWGWRLEGQNWTYPGKEGQTMTVNVYSRAPKVRLYLNDEVMGEQATNKLYKAEFAVGYKPGELRAVNLNDAGEEMADECHVLKTTGAATDIRLVYEDKYLSADVNDIAYVTIELVDEHGNVVVADNTTAISIESIGAGELVACGTACPNDMRSFRSSNPVVYNGRALAIVRSDGRAGSVRLSVKVVEKVEDPMEEVFKNEEFSNANLDGWTVSDSKYMKYRGDTWKSTELGGFLECFVGWGNASTLAGQEFSQTSNVLPAGEYVLTFNYNGTYYNGYKHYATDGTMKGVSVSIGGQTLPLTMIDADKAQSAKVAFVIEEPAPVTLSVKFAPDTNADWFAFDNVYVEAFRK